MKRKTTKEEKEAWKAYQERLSMPPAPRKITEEEAKEILKKRQEYLKNAIWC